MATKKKMSAHRSGSDNAPAGEWTEEQLIEVLRKKAQAYLRLPNVSSVGVGKRIKNGKPTNELCIQFTVHRKLEPSALAAEGLTTLPKKFVDDDGAEIPVDVVQRTYNTSYHLISDPARDAEERRPAARDVRRQRLDTVVPGVSVSNIRETAGTLGAIVYDKDTGRALMLSNWHVLHGPSGEIGDEIVQPGPYDDGDVQRNFCGRLLRSHLGLAGDCAVASIENRKFKEAILEINLAPTKVAKVSLDDKVIKSGRTTGVTYGIVTRVGVVANIDYGGPVGTRQIGGFEIRPDPDYPSEQGEVSMGGDSGSLWLIQDKGKGTDIAVGLHFAGETDPDPGAEHALACNIHSILDKLNVNFVHEGEEIIEHEDLMNALINVLRDQGMQIRNLEQRLIALRATYPQDGSSTIASPGGASSPAQTEGLGLPVYGNWCGPGYGGGAPIDDLDSACMRHDECYGSRGYFDCQCDQQLISDIDAALSNGNVRRMGRFVGPAIRQWFTSVQPCRNNVAGIRISSGTSGLTSGPQSSGFGVRSVSLNGDLGWRTYRRR